jgi:predicted RNA methylase
MSAQHPPVQADGQWTYWERVDFGLFRDILLRRCYWPDGAFVPGAGDVVLDLGANVGAFSVLAAKRMGAGRVFAVEAAGVRARHAGA